MSNLTKLTSSELLTVYNRVTGESVKRFADITTGRKRVQKLLDAVETKAATELQLSLVVQSAPVDEPLPTVGEALVAGLEAGAERQGVPSLKAKVKKPKSDAGPPGLVKMLGLKTKKTKKPKPAAEKPTKREGLVVVAGKVVRTENVARVKKGEALWGAVAAPPKEADALGDARLNLNYPPKDEVKPMREGTMRHKLVTAMRSKGVTVEEVMKMFGISRGAAIYKLRDLHYVSGHGLEVSKGRVFVTDEDEGDE